MLILAAYMSIL